MAERAGMTAEERAMENQPKPHKVVALVDRWGEVRLDIVCPYTIDENRPCKLGIEAERCDWRDFENGAHHDDCPAAKDRAAECSAPEGCETGCWPAEPEECDGWYHGELGHLHETNGCWVQELLSEIGWQEGVRWHRKAEEELVVPLDVFIECDDEEGITLTPWAEITEGAGSR